MASRIKKIFHRSKDDGPEETAHRTRAPASAGSDPAIRTSLYESTTAGGLPQTGDYPIKGNDSTVLLQAGRKTSTRSMRSRRSSSRDSYHDVTRRTAGISPSTTNNTNNPGPYNSHGHYQNDNSPMSGQDDQHKRLDRSSLPHEFGRLNFGTGQGPTTVTSTVTTTTLSHHNNNANRGAVQTQGTIGQSREPTYALASRNIEPQSPYANRGVPHNNRDGGKSNGLGYDPNHDVQANTVVASNPGSSRQGKNATFGPDNLETKAHNAYARRGNGGFGPANLETKSPVRSTAQTERGNAPTQGYSAPHGSTATMNNNNEYQRSAPSRPHRSEGSNYVNHNASDKVHSPDGNQDLPRQKSLTRKQVGASAHAPYSPVQVSTSPNPQTAHNRSNGTKPLPSAPSAMGNDYHTGRNAQTSQSPSILDRSRPVGRSNVVPQNGQDIVDRAKSNTYDTEVIEKVAPAVVHENITKDVHHIREEVINREVHTHDVYHRILPIIDVEVLPPRHFLPVEGGGLVEVSAAEVPGRGHNWVIAETASKIPSDQAAPQGRRRFTAREFPGREGDTIKYLTPDGYEKTEETWVHPPELEEGARLTGQTWPMEFEDNATSKLSHTNATSGQTNRKSPKKGHGSQASPALGNGDFKRTAQSSTT